MASYLLNAREDEMERWREAARLRRIPFSIFLRQAADTFAAMAPSVGPTKPPTTTVALPASTAPAPKRRRTEMTTKRQRDQAHVELEARARSEPEEVLRTWLHDSRRYVKQVARNELKRRGL